MIRGYTKIAFVYGQSTKKIADNAKKFVEEKYKNYPLKIQLCDDSSFRAAKEAPIVEGVVRGLFDDADFAVIFVGKDMLTYDFSTNDFNDSADPDLLAAKKAFGNQKTIEKEHFATEIGVSMTYKMSQNAVLEIGYFWGKFSSFNKIRFVTTFPYGDTTFKFPSDIPAGFLFTYSEFEESIDSWIKLVLNIRPNNNVLYDKRYRVDYRDLFTPEELEVVESQSIKKVEERFKCINELWVRQVATFTKNYERILFVYERLVFLSYFPRDMGLDEWLNNAVSSINTAKFEGNEKDFCDILTQIRKYINTRALDNQVNVSYFSRYKSIAGSLLELKENLSNTEINPLIEIYLNDYLGLVCRASVESYRKMSEQEKSSDANDFNEDKYLEHSIKALKRCEEIESISANEAAILWKGYSLYNLARTYQLAKEETLSKHTFIDTYETRNSWRNFSTLGSIPSVFQHSFRAEYALIAIDVIKGNYFNETRTKEIEVLLKETIDNLISTKIESVSIANTAKKRYSELINL